MMRGNDELRNGRPYVWPIDYWRAAIAGGSGWSLTQGTKYPPMDRATAVRFDHRWIRPVDPEGERDQRQKRNELAFAEGRARPRTLVADFKPQRTETLFFAHIRIVYIRPSFFSFLFNSIVPQHEPCQSLN